MPQPAAHEFPGASATHPRYSLVLIHITNLATLYVLIISLSPSSAMSASYAAANRPAPARTSSQVHGEHSKEDLATAALLHSFNHSEERYQTHPTSNIRAHGDSEDTHAGAPPARGSKTSEISEYHSLDDAISYQHISRSPPQPSNLALNTTNRPSPGVTPTTGQVCR